MAKGNFALQKSPLELFMNPQTIAVPVELFNAVQNYMATKPFQEVAPLINGMNQAAQQQQAALQQAQQPSPAPAPAPVADPAPQPAQA